MFPFELGDMDALNDDMERPRKRRAEEDGLISSAAACAGMAAPFEVVASCKWR